jgi:hypothetical protein
MAATANSGTYTAAGQSVSPTSTAQNTVWNSAAGYETYYVNNLFVSENTYSPIYYDLDNTNYYINPASTSSLIGLTVSNTISGSITGTAGSLASYQSNWSSTSTIGNVVGMLAWKNYGNNHVIFDASNSTTPSGTSCSNTNPQNNWTGTYPTLMGWNGSGTYGVRVDSARVADSAGSAGSVDFNNLTNKTGGTGTYQTSGDFRAPIFYDSNDTTYYINPADSTTAANFAGKVQFNYGGASSSTLIQTTGSYGTMGINTYYGVMHTSGNFYIGNPAGGAADLTANNANFSVLYDRANTAYYFDGNNT